MEASVSGLYQSIVPVDVELRWRITPEADAAEALWNTLHEGQLIGGSSRRGHEPGSGDGDGDGAETDGLVVRRQVDQL